MHKHHTHVVSPLQCVRMYEMSVCVCLYVVLTVPVSLIMQTDTHSFITSSYCALVTYTALPHVYVSPMMSSRDVPRLVAIAKNVIRQLLLVLPERRRDVGGVTSSLTIPHL